MTAEREEPRRVRFERFELDLGTGELRCEGRPVPLQDKPLAVLRALVDERGRVVSRDELRHRLWSADTHVDFDNNLNAAVKKLRDALEDSADEPRFIETLPRKGYRFLATVEPPGDRTRRTPVALAAAALLGAIGVWIGLQASDEARPTSPDRARLVVLPLQSLGLTQEDEEDEEDEILASGITEELTTHLGRLSPEELGVIARSSAFAYHGARPAPDDLRRDLGVDYFIEGAVRRHGERVRVTVQLVQISDETQLWSENYEADRMDALALQRALAVDVARAVSSAILGGPIETRARADTTLTEAYRAYLRGRHALRRFDRDSLERATGEFERAVELDPVYAVAHVGLAESRQRLGVEPELAKRAAERAIELDPSLAEAHAALGVSLLYSEWDFAGARRALDRALALNPDSSGARHTYAVLHAAEGRLHEAIESVKRGLVLDPRSQPLRGDLGWYLLAAGRNAEAIEECERLVDEAPAWGLECLSLAHAAEGRHAEAASELRRSLESLGVRLDDAPAPESASELRRLHGVKLKAMLSPGGGRACPVQLAQEYLRLGEPEEALRWLQRAVRERAPAMLFVAVNPSFAELRSDERFTSLVRRVRAD